jgi:hypothetical protein
LSPASLTTAARPHIVRPATAEPFTAGAGIQQVRWLLADGGRVEFDGRLGRSA